MSHRTITRVTNTAACLLAGLAAVFASPALAQDDPAALEKAKLEQRRADVEVRRAQAQAYFTQRREQNFGDRIIYGADDRLDTYQVTDPFLLSIQQAAAVVVSDSEVTNNGNGTYTLSTAPWNTQGGTPLCATEPFRGQLTIGFCSAFLVGPDIIVTAGHCFSAGDVGNVAFVFGFDQRGPTNSAADSPATTVSEDNVYFSAQLLGRQLAGDLDYAVIRLDRPVVGRTPLPVRRSGTVGIGEPLVMVGHGVTLPKKTDAGGVVQDNSNAGYFTSNVDAYGGNSGSMVVNANTGVIEGILVRGNTDFVTSGGCVVSNRCADTGCAGSFEEISKATTFASFIPELGLSVTPAGGVLSLGPVGGPFSNPSTIYTLNNPTSNAINYEVSIVSGATAPLLINGGTSTISGSVPAASSVNVTVTYDNAAALAAGTYTGTVRFTDLTNSLNQDRAHSLEIGQTAFSVTPATGLTASGPVGGPFSGSASYTVTNTRPTPVTVTATPADGWLLVNGLAGAQSITLNNQGDSASFTITTGPGADSLPAGLYTSSVALAGGTNTLSDTTRSASLEVGRLTYASTDVPRTISDNSSFESTLIVPDAVCVGSLEVPVDITHTFQGDLIVEVISPDGTTVRLHNRTGSSADNIITTFADSGTGGTRAPDGPGLLADFAGKPAAGTWRLRVSDNANIDTGTLNGWGLRLVPLAGACPPSANNVTVAVEPNRRADVALSATGDGPIDYVVLSLPASGTLHYGLGQLITSDMLPFTIPGSSEMLKYRPAHNSIGTHSFTYRATNGNDSNTATVTLNIGQNGPIYSFPLDSNPGWTTTGSWQFGVPQGLGTAGRTDPASAFSGANVFGTNLAGDYANSITSTMWLTTGALDFSGATNITLSFQRWLGIESSSFDQARIELSTNNGSTWSTIWAHSGAALNDRSWQSVSYSLPTAAGASAVLVRWGLGPTDSSVTYGGWNLDDIVFTGIAPPNDPPCPADFDGSGFVDSDDFVEFNAMFELGDPAADADGSTFVDSDDFVHYVSLFAAGC